MSYQPRHMGGRGGSPGCCMQRGGGGGVHPSVTCPYPPLLPVSSELHSKLQSSEAEVKSKSEELSGLHGQLKEARAENSQLMERIRSIANTIPTLQRY